MLNVGAQAMLDVGGQAVLDVGARENSLLLNLSIVLWSAPSQIGK